MTPTVLVPFPGGAQVEFVYSIGGKIATNRIWLYNLFEDTDQSIMDTLAPAVTSFWVSSLMPSLADSCELLLVRCRSWDNPLSPLTSFTLPNVFGGVSGPVHSASVAIRVSFRWPTQHNDKVNGNFVPGIPESEVNVNTYSSSIMGALFDHYVRLIDAVRSFDPGFRWIWVCVSLERDKALRSSMHFAECDGPIFNSPYIAPQRHRLRV